MTGFRPSAATQRLVYLQIEFESFGQRVGETVGFWEKDSRCRPGMTGISGANRVSRCSMTADCAPKLEDSAGWSGACCSAQHTRFSALSVSRWTLSVSRSSRGGKAGSTVMLAALRKSRVGVWGYGGSAMMPVRCRKSPKPSLGRRFC